MIPFDMGKKMPAAVELGRRGGLARAATWSREDVRKIMVKAAKAAAVKRSAAKRARDAAKG